VNAHLTRGELEQWSAGLSSDRDRIVRHLAECDDCGALYGVVMREASMRGDAGSSIVERGYGAYRGKAAPPPAFPVWWRSAALAAAAAIAVAAITIPVLRRTGTGSSPDTIRAATIQPLAPIGEVPPPLEFRWASAVQAARFRVDVRDADRRLLFTLTSEQEAIDIPAERRGELTAGRTYSWEVTALSADNEEIMRAPSRSFTISR
jgi:hypothetical protein